MYHYLHLGFTTILLWVGYFLMFVHLHPHEAEGVRER